jgi:hypothetical protein
MNQFLWSVQLRTPIVLSMVVALSVPAIANEIQIPESSDISVTTAENLPGIPASEPLSELPTEQPGTDSIAEDSALNQMLEYVNEDSVSIDQVTSISQLSDVQPTDWAFQALQSLVERYGCIAGYPDGTYRGQSAMTRYEFAAGLNACLDRISELIAASTEDLATREDLATLQRLQEEFAAELATLRGRVDDLEARVAEVEENQFSTTTTLRGETLFLVGVPFETDDDAFSSDQAIGGYRVRLNFDTSFTGEDLLRARLQAREFNNFSSFGGTAGSGIGATRWSIGSTSAGDEPTPDIVLDDLFYSFPATDRIQVIIGANSFAGSDWVASTISPFDSSGSGALTGFGTPSQYYFIPGDFGVGAIVQLTDNLSLDFAYSAAEPGDPSEGSGLFNGDYGAIAQFTFLSDFVDAALTYGNGYRSAGFFSAFGINSEDDPEIANTYGGQVNFKFGQFQIGGGIAYVPIRQIGNGDYDVWSYQATLALVDLGGEGNLLGILGGVTPYASSVPVELDSAINQDNNVLVEGFYRFQLNDKISITPSLIWLSAPGNDDSNGDTFVGALRTTFSF